MKTNLNKRTGAALALLLAGPALAGDGGTVRMRWVMGTFCQIEARGARADEAVAAAFEEIDRWDRLLSLYKKESELCALNRSAGLGPFRASPPFYAAARAALDMARRTDGAFDPTVLPVLRGGPAALPLVGWRKVRLDDAARTIELPEAGMGLDFGGIGKGWALDRAADVLRAHGVDAAFLNFGGQILALGRPAPGAPWTVSLRPGEKPLEAENSSVSTSGDTERPGHIISPFDGLPVRRELSATVVLPAATEADAWSTALYVLGKIPASFSGRAFILPSPRKNALLGANIP